MPRNSRQGIYLFETKTKGDIDEEMLRRQLASGFDLQTMLYLVALVEFLKMPPGLGDYQWQQVKGVRYNVVRRPLSGGKGSISQKKGSKNIPPETADEFYTRLGGIIEEQPEHFFMRWKVDLLPQDIERFKTQCLNPILEQLCDWWQVIGEGEDGKCKVWSGTSAIHFRYPYGVWNSMLEGGCAEVDEYLNTGSEAGLRRGVKLFKELE